MRAIARRCEVTHPNLVGARRGRDEYGWPAAILAVCPEPTLFELLESGPLSVSRATELTGGVAAALDALAGAGLVGRELTPEHVHLDPQLGGILADTALPFDVLAPEPVDADRHVAFRSPEQLAGDAVDLRSNVYSLGVLLFTALVGKPPFGGSWSHVYVAHLDAERPRLRAARPRLPKDIDAVVARALAIDPDARYETPSELARAVADALKVPLPAAIEPAEQPAPALALAPEPAPLPAPAPAVRAAPALPAEAPPAAAPVEVPPTPAPAEVRKAPAAHRRARPAARAGGSAHAQVAVAVVPLDLEAADVEALAPAVVAIAQLEREVEASNVIVELKPRPHANGHVAANGQGARPRRRGLRTGIVIALGAVSLAGAATVVGMTGDQGDSHGPRDAVSKNAARSAPAAGTGAAHWPVAPATIRSVLEQLSAENLKGRTRLARARFAEVQARAARNLEESYRSAAARIDAAGSAARPALAALSVTLTATADRFGELSVAITVGDAEAYDVARLALIDLETQLQRDETAALAG